MSFISVNNVGKAYKQYPSKSSRLVEWISPTKKLRHKLKWILNDISFQVQPGEALGIIGINGAGKSTLLKLITGTAKPTTGEVHLEGRVAAMLELGMGFHPDFTGRQNAYMSGQLLGMSSQQITELMPEIEAFAEIGDYIDEPVRVYSSGMQVRLAFSIATAIRPDILIVDEALSVGDAYFQHKSFARIREFREKGTTLLLVSHDKSAIQSICDRAILLNKGRIEKEGNPEEIMDFYNAMLAEKSGSAVTIRQEKTESGQIQTISGNGDAKVSAISLINSSGKVSENIGVGDRVTLKIEVEIHRPIKELVMGFQVKDRLGQVVFGTNSYHMKEPVNDLEAGQKVTFNYRFPMNLGEGNFSIATALHDRDTHINNNYEWRDLALVFNVINLDKLSFMGVSWLQTELECSYER
ncbi:ATP-binding cassette domain-containing protein [Rouxiella sp. S1S-2]|uniref:ABC transporter ATP-binding protein n=1 Tax=Rouxiella sp. S1S-2 TaxID=2653856 RepID=UPI001264D7BF|nr:ABC transporter ATP-binding protein [Rouxiella sp. S1S-2]KAB7897083.1 ATP-binding cassette domain-containing protein [Rouxiella sp. S1S-2]